MERQGLETAPSPLPPDEKPMQTGGFEPSWPPLTLLGFSLLMLLLAGPEFQLFVWMGVAALWLYIQYWNSGRYQVTQAGVSWHPTRGTPIQIPLHAIDPQGVKQLFGKRVRIRRTDGTSITLKHIGSPQLLVALLRGESLFIRAKHDPLSRGAVRGVLWLLRLGG